MTSMILIYHALSDEDADYIADWMAKACSRTDCFKYLAIGKSVSLFKVLFSEE